MYDPQEGPEEGGLNRTWLAIFAISAGAVLCAIITVAWGIGRYYQLGRSGEGGFVSFLEILALMLSGLGLSLLLWGCAEILRALQTLPETLREAQQAGREKLRSEGQDSLERGAYWSSGRTEAAALEEVRSSLEELTVLMRELRDISLLSETERKLRVEAQGRALVGQLQQEIPALLAEHQWVEARRRVQQARARFPSFREWDELEQRIEAMRSAVEARDIEAAQRQIDDLLALGAFDRAMSVARDLLDRHPQSPKAQEIARRVSLQREKVDAERRAKLMAQAQEAVHRREWNRALSLANDLIRRFPKSSEAEALRQQLPTLAENAEIQTRQQMEQQFREFLREGKFQAALQLAQELIERYPNSPQAEVLREQLPRLQERLKLR
jgi:hypothetical protein